jgi:PAS domain S-box-containing protein
MSWRYTPYILPLLLAAGISGLLAFSAWRNRQRRGSESFILLTLTVVFWSLVYAVQLGCTELKEKIFWTNLLYLGITLAPAAWLLFTLQYTGQAHRITRRMLLLLAIEPLLTLLIAFTDPWHHLFRSHVGLNNQGNLLTLEADFAIGFWIHTVYSYTLLLVGNIILVRAYLHAPRLYRRQTIALLIAALAPWVSNALYLTGYSPLAPLDITPFAFTITVMALGWGVLRLQLLDVVPVARVAVIESMQDGVIVLDEQNRVVDINPAAQEITGHSDADIVGQPAQKIFGAYPDLMARYSKTDRTQDEVVLTVDGQERIYDLRISPLFNRRPRPIGRLIVLRDITEEQEAAQERERLIAELNAFSHTVAHDLKTPLTAMIASAEILEKRGAGNLAPSEQRNVQMLNQSARKMNNIVDELLLLAGVRRRKEIQIKPLEMDAILAEALQRLSYLIETHNAEIVAPEQWPPARGYAPWIEEVWVNYISNAIKYGGHPPRVELGADLQENHVRFWVRDNGKGLTESAQRRLFTPFTRLGQIKAEGHGLGLSIVQRIVTRLDGEVGVESQKGQGSVFSFTLPTADR